MSNPFAHLFAPRSFADKAPDPPHRTAAAAGPGQATLRRAESISSASSISASEPPAKKKRVQWSQEQANDSDKATSKHIRPSTPPRPAASADDAQDAANVAVEATTAAAAAAAAENAPSAAAPVQSSVPAAPTAAAQASSSKTLVSSSKPSASAPAAAPKPAARTSPDKPVVARTNNHKPGPIKKAAWDPLAPVSVPAAKPAAWDPLAPPPKSAPIVAQHARSASQAGPSNHSSSSTSNGINGQHRKPALAPLQRFRQPSNSSVGAGPSRSPMRPPDAASPTHRDATQFSPPGASSGTFPQTPTTPAAMPFVSTTPLDTGRRSSSGAPILTPSEQLSNKVAIMERNKHLEVLYKSFRAAYGLAPDGFSALIVLPEPNSNASSSVKLYEGDVEAPAIVDAVLSSLASAHARRTEAEAFRTASKESYKFAARSPMVSLGKRKNDKEALERITKARQNAVEDVTEHLASAASADECVTQAALESVAHALFRSDALGTGSELARRRDERTRRENGRLTLQRLQEAYFLAPPEKLALFGFSIPPLPGADAANGASPILTQGGAETSAAAAAASTSAGAYMDLQAALEQAWGLGDSAINDGIEERRTCERCKAEFTVRDVQAQLSAAHVALALAEAEAKPPADDMMAEYIEERELGEEDRVRIAAAKKALASAERVLEECSFHWGRARVEKENGTIGGRGNRVMRYTCCGAVDGASAFGSLAASAAAAGFAGATVNDDGAGCTRGPHVWKAEEVKMLHSFAPFVTVAAIRARVTAESSLADPSASAQRLANGFDPMRWIDTREVVALDAELVYTTAGMSIARVTLVDEDGSQLADYLVRPKAPVVDYNTRFSGVRAGDLDEALTLTQVQDKIVQWIGPETVIIGHGLENDLRALRLVHTRVADSALLFPHPHGLPKRRGLKELAKDHLGLSIQTGGAEGHSSAEDARVALNLIKWKYAGEPETSPFRPVRKAAPAIARPIVQRPGSNSTSGSPPPTLGSPPLGRDAGSSTQTSPMHSPMLSHSSTAHARHNSDADKAQGAAARAAARTAAARVAAAEEAAAKIAMAEELAAEQAAEAEAAVRAKAAASAAPRKVSGQAKKKADAAKAKADKAAKAKAAAAARKAAKEARAWSESPEPGGSSQGSSASSPTPSPEPELEPEPAVVKAKASKRVRLIPEVVIDVRPPRRRKT